MDIMRDLAAYIKSKCTLIALESVEETRALAAIHSVARATEVGGMKRLVVTWSVTRGFKIPAAKDGGESTGLAQEIVEPSEALSMIWEQASMDKPYPAHIIYVLLDFSPFVDKDARSNIDVIRKMREIGALLRSSGGGGGGKQPGSGSGGGGVEVIPQRTVLMLAPSFNMGPGLIDDVVLMKMPLPTLDVLERAMDELNLQVPESLRVSGAERDAIVQAGRGLTVPGFSQALARSLVLKSSFDAQLVSEERRMLIQKSGLLEWLDNTVTLEAVGGLESMKRWATLRKLGFKKEALKYGLSKPKGVLLAGPPGCLHADTPIADPIDGSVRTVAERHTIGQPFHVVAMDGLGEPVVARADAPWKYPPAEMVRLSWGGGSIVVTLGHKFWDGSTFISAAEVCERLQSGERVLLPTSSGHYRRATMHIEIVKAEPAGVHEYYDFHVPQYENYEACGLWHHNTGKSLSARALAGTFGLPLLRSRQVKDSFVGASEKNMQAQLDLLSAVAPCAWWVDEAEKLFAGSRPGVSGATDGGVGSNMLGQVLSWMQEQDGGVFIIMTSNDVTSLPSELLRKGRLDELFFVDLPNDAERRSIWEVKIREKGRDADAFDIPKLAEESVGMMGAEIFGVLETAMFDAFASDAEVGMSHLEAALKRVIPLSVTKMTEMKEMRSWCQGKLVLASDPDIGDDDDGSPEVVAGRLAGIL